MPLGRYALSSVKFIFRTGQPNHDGDRKTSKVMTVIFPLETRGSVGFCQLQPSISNLKSFTNLFDKSQS